MDPVNNSSQPPVNPSPQPPSVPPVQNQRSDNGNDVTGVDSNKLMAALSYIGILVIIPLLISRHDKFVLFHAKQGLILLIGYVLATIVSSWISILGNLLVLAILIASIVGLIQALQGKWWKMPLVGDLAAKFKI